MYRWLAASLFVCAAFALVPPGLDRAGLALCGLAALALAVGRRPKVELPNVGEASDVSDLFSPEALAEAQSEVERMLATSGLRTPPPND